MNARSKLNIAYISGSLVVASAIGILTGSWAIFGLLFAVFVVANLYDGNIRHKR